MIHTYSPTKNTFTVYACSSPSVPFPTSARSRTLRRTDKSHSHPDPSPAIRLQSAARTRHSAHCSRLPMEPPLVHPVSEARGWSIRERIGQYESEITDIFQRCCNPAFPHPVSSIHPLPTSLLLLLFSQWTHPSSTSAGGPTPPPLPVEKTGTTGFSLPCLACPLSLASPQGALPKLADTILT